MLASAALFMTGCPSYTMLQSPEVMAEGETRFTVAPGFIGATAEGAGLAAPTVEFGLRHGVADKMDFGVRFYPVGLAFDFKYQFVDSPQLDVSFAPGLSGFAVGSSAGGGGLVYLHLPVLVGINLSDSFALVLAPRANVITAFGGGTAGAGLQLGSGAGLHFKLSESFVLMPEFVFMRTIGGTEDVAGYATLFQATLGLQFGGLLAGDAGAKKKDD